MAIGNASPPVPEAGSVSPLFCQGGSARQPLSVRLRLRWSRGFMDMLELVVEDFLSDLLEDLHPKGPPNFRDPFEEAL